MLLTPMRYKEYVWPHNPRVYSIDYERIMAVNKVPFGLYYLQDLGRTRRVMKGEGEFIGEDAYTQFGQLANVFYSGGPGQLIHPLWQTANAYFVSLRLEQEPMRDYVRYSFEFWEEANYYSGQVRTWTTQSSQLLWYFPDRSDHPGLLPGGEGRLPVVHRPAVRHGPQRPDRLKSPN